MEIKLTLNGRSLTASIGADTLLIDLVRDHGCYSVKRGCETANCGLCTVLLDGTPVLSCSVLAARVAGRHVQTLEGLQAAQQRNRRCHIGVDLAADRNGRILLREF